jgi:hypothetical protein
LEKEEAGCKRRGWDFAPRRFSDGALVNDRPQNAPIDFLSGTHLWDCLSKVDVLQEESWLPTYKGWLGGSLLAEAMMRCSGFRLAALARFTANENLAVSL